MVDISSLTPGETYKELNTSRRGMTSEEAAKKLSEYGPNVLIAQKSTPIYYRLIAQFTDLFAVLLEIGSLIAFVSYFIGRDIYQLYVAIAIIMVVILNAIIGFFQEYRAEKATEALKKLVPVFARVARDGERIQIPAEEVVPGDLLVLEEGDNIVADARIVEEFELRTNNMTLTGESSPVKVTSEPIKTDGLAKTDIRNLIFMGTSVATGNGAAVVLHTGMYTQFGEVFRLTTTAKEPPSPLEKQVDFLAKRVAVIAIIIGFILFGVALQLSMGYVEAFLFALGVMMALVPQGLPATMSVSLALAIQRMAKSNVLIKKLSAVETLGSTNVICTDKTGTLTKAEMTVKEMWISRRRLEVGGVGYEPIGVFSENGRELSAQEVLDAGGLMFKTAILASTARLVAPDDEVKNWTILGDSTEASLIVAAAKAGLNQDEILDVHPKLYQFPFESVRKRMSSIHRSPDSQQVFSYVKGAPKEVLGHCVKILINGKIEKLTDELRSEVLEANDAYARESLRVLAMAYREMSSTAHKFTQEEAEKDLVFIGLMAMADPPRPEVADAVTKAKRAGIRIIMITGDYGLTAEAIARRIGIVTRNHCRIVTGIELEAMSEDEFAKVLETNYEIIFARVAPEQKLQISQTLREQGNIVAMTGDGVNDAPALKAADIGVAMGVSGTDVSKEAAVMVLLDDSFASIVTAIEEGRGVYSNIKRFVLYIFSHNLSELSPFLFASFSGINLIPMGVLQVLTIDLGSDVLPGLALGTEQPEPGIMDQPPRPRNDRLMNAAAVKRLLFLGLIQSLGSVGGFLLTLYLGGWHWGQALDINTSLLYRQAVTMTQGGVVVGQFFNGFAIRTDKVSVFRIGLFSNRRLIYGEIIGLIIFALISYVPLLNNVLHTGPLGLVHWLILFGFGILLFVAEESRKAVARWRDKNQVRIDK
ncbi:MAG: cation-transporting P-type ATPase [Actinomycetota bacterium]